MTRTPFTHHTITLGLTVGLVATLAVTQVEAQRWGRPGAPRSGACFYRDANFEGDYFCVRAGEAIEALPRGMDNQISSIRTFGTEVEVTVYRDPGFGGRFERFGDVRNLQEQGWNDRLSSLQVESLSRSGIGRRDPGFGASRQNAERVVRRAYQDILGRNPDGEGLRVYRSRIIDDGWTEDQVRDALRRSPEYRERSTMTPQRAAEIVRRAYLSVLKREPDAASQGFVERVLRDKWTEQDVARELRRSPEYREQRRGR